MKKEKDELFEVFYNALSVGWHLSKIVELDESLLLDTKHWKLFKQWLERHNCKPKNV